MRKYGCHYCHTDVSVRWCDSRPGDDVLMGDPDGGQTPDEVDLDQEIKELNIEEDNDVS